MPLQLYRSKRAYWHPKWDSDVKNGFDVGLVRLDRKAVSGGVSFDKDGVRLRYGDLLGMAGWGSTEKKVTASVLQSTEDLPVLSANSCEKSLNATLKGHMICIGSIGSDTCRGESRKRSDVRWRQKLCGSDVDRRFGRTLVYPIQTGDHSSAGQLETGHRHRHHIVQLGCLRWVLSDRLYPYIRLLELDRRDDQERKRRESPHFLSKLLRWAESRNRRVRIHFALTVLSVKRDRSAFYGG